MAESTVADRNEVPTSIWMDEIPFLPRWSPFFSFIQVCLSWARARTRHGLGMDWARPRARLGTDWARTRAGWARERGTARTDWARADWARTWHGTRHGLGTSMGGLGLKEGHNTNGLRTGGLGTDWARARDCARAWAEHGRVKHGRIVSERHEYPLVII
jgi:hypothetical protein